MDWYPPAQRVLGNDSGSFVSGYAKKGLLHTTESNLAASAFSAFRLNNSWPHFTVDRDGLVYQHLPITKAARSLANLPGGVETNRAGVIQIEVVGKATEPNWPVAQIEAMKSLMRWVETNAGVKPIGAIFKAYPASYGANNGVRFTNEQWTNWSGWLGHMHAVENLHGDPGAIDINKLLPSPGSTVPVSYLTEVPKVPFTVPRTQGGYIVVGGDGGVFTYDNAPFFGSLPALGAVASVVGAAWTPSGNGYWLLGSDGGIFTFGDAPFHGGFNSLPPEVRGSRKPVGLVAKGNGYKIVTLDSSGDGSLFDGYEFGI